MNKQVKQISGIVRGGTRYELTVTGTFGPDELDDIAHQIRLQRKLLAENGSGMAPTDPLAGFLDRDTPN